MQNFEVERQREPSLQLKAGNYNQNQQNSNQQQMYADYESEDEYGEDLMYGNANQPAHVKTDAQIAKNLEKQE